MTQPYRANHCSHRTRTRDFVRERFGDEAFSDEAHTVEAGPEMEPLPSPWPCVVMLACLLALCLAVPFFWEQGDPQLLAVANSDAATNDGSFGKFEVGREPKPLSESNPHSDTLFARSQFGAFPGSNLEALNVWPQPSLNGFAGNGSAHDGGRLPFQPSDITNPWATENSISIDLGELGGVSPRASIGATGASRSQEVLGMENSEPTAEMLAVIEKAGQFYGSYSPASVVPELISRLMEMMPRKWRADKQEPSIAPVGEATRGGRFTFELRTPQLPKGELSVPESSPWCVPQSLFEQLNRLAFHPTSASWSSHVANQLRALTQREEILGDDVQAILADLSDAAQEALRLADETSDDRLRVELLRTHWALARRIDRWVAIHEERVAWQVSGRVAARGDLSPYFDSSPRDAASPDEMVALSQQLEMYETTRNPEVGGDIVAAQRELSKSPASFDRALADAVEQHYRNANVRVAITAAMINRMMQSERSESKPVHDRIGGAFVRGQSEVTSRSHVQLSPAEREWQLRVRTSGVVESNTMADAGPVRFRSRGATDFDGSKTITIRPDGIHLQPSDVEATSSNRLMGVTTDYDWVPLIGGMARDRAMREYRARQARVRSEMESRVSAEASEMLDRETHEAMERARHNLYDRFTNRFNEYGIKLTTIEMKSTPERLVARVRVAGDDQLGSHTPRPRALSDSLASVQVHETAMTNLAVTLGLDGQHLTGDELQQKIRENFPKLEFNEVETNREVVFHFSAKNAVRVLIHDEQLELVIALDRVELDDNAIDNVIVHAYYAPAVVGLSAQLTREGALGIEGEINVRERAKLHNIFKKVLPPERVISLVRLEPEQEKHFAGLMITQLVLEDGWLGLAIGPQTENRVAERARSLR
ncbi:MAG: hypothetical protein IT425_11805 [Pirellulales bacterium]|nr:hypothetical protein [Pirellulales bacterium]